MDTTDAAPSTDMLVARATRCLLAYRVAGGPAMTPMACWSDGDGLWMSTSRHAAKVDALRRDPRCAVWIEPAHPTEPGVAIDGTARIYDLSDPVSLALHAATITAAVTGLAVSHGPALAGYVRDLPQLPGRWVPRSRVLVRIRIDRALGRLAPQRRSGVGPLLPSELPSAVRRGLTGRRLVTLALQRDATLLLQPCVWGATFALDVGAGVVPDGDTPACIVLDANDEDRPSTKVGLLLRGQVDNTLRFHPRRLVWWHGFASGSTHVRSSAGASGITLPD